MIYKMLY